ncbi:MAG: nuclear transport factor 2 family protein, partial [Actinomycetota bacterium]
GVDVHEPFDGLDAQHPRTHTMTNIYVDETSSGVQLRFRILAMLPEGRMGTASYFDEVVRTADGWRVKDRVVKLRREKVRPDP